MMRVPRALLRHPAHSAAALFSWAIGFGVLAVATCLVDRVVLKPLPYPDADRVVGIWFESPNFPGALGRVRQSKATFLHLRSTARAFDAIGLAEEAALTLDAGEQSTRVRGAQVTAGIFDVLGLPVALGRAFTEADGSPGAPKVAMLTDGAWTRRFSRSPDVVGQSIRIDGVAHEIVGVMPAAARFPKPETELWVPLEIDASRPDPLNFVFTGYGRLRAGVTVEDVRRDLTGAIDRLPDAFPSAFPRTLLERLQLTSQLVPITEETIGAVRQWLALLLGAAAIVLIGVAANVSHLWLVHVTQRRQEFAVRHALGASRRRLVQGLATEAGTLGLAGGAAGLGIATGALALLRTVAAPVIPRIDEVGLDGSLALLILTVSLALGMATGLLAALPLGRARLVDEAGGARVVGSRRAVRLGGVLAATQIAVAVLLASGSGLLARSSFALTAVSPGFDPSNLTGLRIYLAPGAYPDFARTRAFTRDVIADLRALPGIETASAVSFLPLRDGRIFFPYRIENDPRPDALPEPHLTKIVLDGYFTTMRIPVLEGRAIESHDLDAETDAVVVNAAFARAYWPTGTAVGRRIRYDATPAGLWHTVVGVVGDVRDRDLTRPTPPVVYLPAHARHAVDRRWREVSMVVRAAPGADVARMATAAVVARDRDVPVYDVRTMDDVIAGATARSRYAAWLLVALAAGALVVAAIGTHGVLSHGLAGRRRELAVRAALGADPTRLRGIVMRQVALVASLGLTVGLALGEIATTWLASLLFDVTGRNLVVSAGVVAVTAIVASAAAWPSMREAGAASPVDALRRSET